MAAFAEDETYKPVCMGPMPATVRGAPAKLDLSKDGSKILYAAGKCLVIREIATGKCEVYTQHKKDVTVARFSPSGNYIASGDVTGKVRVWAYDHPERLLKCETQALGGEVVDLCWGPDSKRIVAVGSGQTRVKPFMFDTAASLGTCVGPTKRVLSVAYKPTRPYRVTTGTEGMSLYFFEGPPFKFKCSNQNIHSNFVNCVAYAPDGSMFASVASDKKIALFDGKTGDVVGEMSSTDGHKGSVYAVCWSPDSKQLLTSSSDKTCKIWDVESKACISTINVKEKPQIADMQNCVAWKGDCAVSVSLSGDLNLLDIAGAGVKGVIQGHQNSVNCVAVGADGTFVSGDLNGVVCLWKDGVAKRISGKVHTKNVRGVGLGKDCLYSVGWDDKIRVASLSSGEYVSEAVLGGQPKDLSVCPSDGSLVAVATNKGLVLVRDGSVVATSEVSWDPTSVSFAPDGTEIAVGGEDKKVHLFAVDGNTLTEGEPHSDKHFGQITCLAHSPDGKFTAVGDTDRDVRIYDRAAKAYKISGKWKSAGAKITCVAWSPDGTYVAAGSIDTHFYLYNPENPRKKTQVKFVHKECVHGVAFKDPTTLMTCGADGAIFEHKVAMPQ
jgi:WD40 repeat protein